MKHDKWVLALGITVLALTDWMPGLTPADGSPKEVPFTKIGAAEVRILEKEVTVDGKKEIHLFLEQKTEGNRGEWNVRLTRTDGLVRSRMPALPVPVWKKKIVLKGREIDLGAAPAKTKLSFHTVTAHPKDKPETPVVRHLQPSLQLNTNEILIEKSPRKEVKKNDA